MNLLKRIRSANIFKRSKLSVSIISGIFTAVFFTSIASAGNVVTITEGNKKLKAIVIADFSGPYGAQIAQVIREDLNSTGDFRVIEPTSGEKFINDINTTPIFTNWSNIGVKALLIGTSQEDNLRITQSFRLWDTYGQEQLLGLEFSSSSENWRKVAHKISDTIYQKMTGKNSAIFDSRLVYIANVGTKNKPINRIAMMDQDGSDIEYLTNGDEQILNPSFSKDGKQLIYASRTQGETQFWVMNLDNGQKEIIDGLSNIAYGPKFASDGENIIFSSNINGNIDIYNKNLRTGKISQITHSQFSENYPDYSNNMESIIFTSNRSGSSQIYKMRVDGSSIQKLSNGEGEYSNPIWSYDDKKIAFIKKIGDKSIIGIMSADGTDELDLISAYSIKNISFSPNGQNLVFEKQDSPKYSPSIFTLNLNNKDLRQINTLDFASSPIWSPYLN